MSMPPSTESRTPRGFRSRLWLYRTLAVALGLVPFAISQLQTFAFYALTDPPVLADDPAQPLELARQLPVEFDDLIEGAADFAVDAVIGFGQPHREVAVLQGDQSGQQHDGIERLPGERLAL